MYKKLLLCLVLFFLVFAVSVSAVSIYCYRIFVQAGPAIHSSFFIVRPGANLNLVASELQEKNLIISANYFKVAAIWLGYRTKIKAGEYKFYPRASMQQILSKLVAGQLFEHSFTVPEGFTVEQVVQKIKSEPALLGELPVSLPKEGSLFTNTLKFLRGQSRASLLKRLETKQQNLVISIWQGRDRSIALKNYDQLIVMASLIEKETGLDDERSLVASVFYNRLAKNMRLQSDATVIYGKYGGKGKPPNEPIYSSDLTDDNIYNTYKILGLPAAAIANPGRKSLLAAAHPAKTSYLYFVADGTGKHIFSANLQDHNVAVKKLRMYENLIKKTGQRTSREGAV